MLRLGLLHHVAQLNQLPVLLEQIWLLRLLYI